jgi:hypothetical protein
MASLEKFEQKQVLENPGSWVGVVRAPGSEMEAAVVMEGILSA